MPTCPVCGKPANKALFSEYRGEIYYFACPACKVRFEEDPPRYLTAGPLPHDHHHHDGHHHPD
ncbi:MAG: YHS domain-containing protein [Armatimonadota bacterium]|nr:YHS domain-containing protein [Armatimonadota bacterium]MDR7466773.1 YHS domain-containing protein [Armatimonadota bacterium]MDR7492754.1 YHS domain-containing protein [Armatimonadota bacterium]MDR7498530.1 YHS domain-containing protein [Armatimonadota bacterium]MDR7504309.1 YHS domain-containing protein [Armatimonadota bacterium]